MKNIIKSLLVIVAVGAVAGGATWAYFSNIATSTGNVYASGTMDLKLTDNNETDLDDVTVSFGKTNLFPGEVIPNQELKVKNAGTISGHHLNLTVTLPTGLDTDLAKNIILKKADADNGLRFGVTTLSSDSENLVAALLGISVGSGDYTMTRPNGTAFAGIDTDSDSQLSLNELAHAGTIRITPGSNNEGIAATTQATLWLNAMVDTDLTTQGQTVNATFTWEIQQDAIQQ